MPATHQPLNSTLRNRLIYIVLTVSAILMGLVIFLHLWKGVPINRLTQDPTIIGGLAAYAGFLSQTGIFFWSATATLCFFSVTLLSDCMEQRELRLFLLVSGLLTLLLGLDDAFLLHESVLPYFGIPQNFVLGSYVVFVMLYLLRFHQIIFQTDYILLAIALSFFGISVILDVLNPPVINPLFFEDGSKLVGIVSWLAYFLSVGLSSNLGTSRNSAPKTLG